MIKTKIAKKAIFVCCELTKQLEIDIDL